jgi:hypothetical protein
MLRASLAIERGSRYPTSNHHNVIQQVTIPVEFLIEAYDNRFTLAIAEHLLDSRMRKIKCKEGQLFNE